MGLLAFLAVGAFFMVNVDLPPWSHWLSGMNVVLFAVPAFWATRRWLGWRDAAILWAVLGVYALLVETSAILTGFPYGHFGYSDLLGVKLFGTTPWTVCLAWTPLMIAAYAVSASVFRNPMVRIICAALIVTAFDLVLDPGAVRLGFWHYAGGGEFYGVPVSNFVGWLVSGAVGAVLIEIFTWLRKPLLPIPIQLASSAVLIIFFWTSIAVFAGMAIPVLIGISILIVLIFLWIRFAYRFDEMLVLADDAGVPIATKPKADVHTDDTPLHLAFSIFLFNSRGELMLQRRSLTKKTWPGVWSNSCCGHVMLHETSESAAKRRIKYEIGISGVTLHKILSDYRYRAEKDGIVENEICPVFVCFTDKKPKPRADEIAEIRWVKWSEFLSAAGDINTGISPWAVEEASLLAESVEFQHLFALNTAAVVDE